MHKNIKTVAGCFTNVTCNVSATDGREVELTAYIAIGQERRPVLKSGANIFAFPAVEYGQHLYEIRADGKPLIFGFLLVRPSAFPVEEGAVDYTLNATLDSVEALHVDIELTPGPRGYSAYDIAVQDGFEGTEAEWLENMRQQTATLAVEQVTPLMERAETAADKSESAASAAKTERESAAAHAAAAKESELAAAKHKTAAADEVEKAKLERETAATHATAAAQSQQEALDNQQAAARAAQEAAQAQTGAEQAKTDADAAKLAAQTSEQNAKASADAAAADKAAAEQAKNAALAAQTTAEEQAAIATKAAEDAQAPESIAAQSARLATMLLVKDELMSILGDSSLFDIDTDGQKIIVHTDRLSDDKLAPVNDMLERFVPGFIEVVQYNHNMEISWRDLPVYFPLDRINMYDKCETIDEVHAVGECKQNIYQTEKGRTFAYTFSNLKAWRDYHCTYGNCDFAWVYAPVATTLVGLFRYWSCREIWLWAPQATAGHVACFANDCRKLTVYTPKLTDGYWLCPSSALAVVDGEFPALKTGENMFGGARLNKESALRILNSIPAHTSGSHPLVIGIHVDHQQDEEVLAAIANAEAKGWTLTVQWNGTPTSTASTFGFGQLIYAKVGEIERPDGTTEKVLDWGHYVTNPEDYETFRSRESAYEYFGLPMPEESFS